MLDAKAPPTGAGGKEAAPNGEVGIFAAITADRALSGIGELLRSRQEAVSLLSEALREGSEACPPFLSSLPPRLGGAPGAPRNPADRRVADPEGARQRRNDVETGSLNTGQRAPSYPRYIVAGAVAGA